MRLTVVLVATYGIVTLIGGAIGYLKAKSTASLVAGTISGSLLLVCAYGISRESLLATVGSLVIALLLGGRFFSTWRRTHRLMPDLIMLVLSVVTLIVVGLSFVK